MTLTRRTFLGLTALIALPWTAFKAARLRLKNGWVLRDSD